MRLPEKRFLARFKYNKLGAFASDTGMGPVNPVGKVQCVSCGVYISTKVKDWIAPGDPCGACFVPKHEPRAHPGALTGEPCHLGRCQPLFRCLHMLCWQAGPPPHARVWHVGAFSASTAPWTPVALIRRPPTRHLG